MIFGFWKQGASRGVALWILVFIMMALLDYFGFPMRTMTANIVLLLVTAVVAWGLAGRLRFISITQGIALGFLWACMSILLDVLIVGLWRLSGDISFLAHWVTGVRLLILVTVPTILSSRRQTP